MHKYKATVTNTLSPFIWRYLIRSPMAFDLSVIYVSSIYNLPDGVKAIALVHINVTEVDDVRNRSDE